MAVKKLRFFAGPNGSGKTTLIKQIRKQFNIGYYINADIIEAQLNSKKYIECTQYFPGTLGHADWLQYLKSTEGDNRMKALSWDGISLKEGIFVSRQPVNSYHAAVIAAFFREKLLLKEHTFSFETVMSHDSKVSFLKEAKKHGFKTYLYFICTQDPEINKQRIKNRVRTGGHDVLMQKIEHRYLRSLDLLYEAFSIADRAFILDNSEESRSVILEKKED